MRDALRSPAHRRAPKPETHSERVPPPGTTPRKSTILTPLPTQVVRPLQKSQRLPSLWLGFPPLDKNILPLPRQCFIDTDLSARTKSVSARRVLGLRPLPAPVKNISPFATKFEQGSATGETVARAVAVPGPIEFCLAAHAPAGSSAHAGAVERGRDIGAADERGEITATHSTTVAAVAENLEAFTEEQLGESCTEEELERLLEALQKAARLEKDKRELRLLFASGRDTGFISDVSGSSPAAVHVKKLMN